MTNQTELEQMSDAELNMMLAELRYSKKGVIESGEGILCITRTSGLSKAVNYTKVPNDICPIQFELGISLEWYKDYNNWDATTDVYCATETSPLRAIVIVAILVLMEKG